MLFFIHYDFMKKMTISLIMNDLIYNMLNKYVPLHAIETSEVLDIIKIDMDNFYKIVLVKIIMKPGYTTKILEESEQVEIISTIQKDDQSITCLMKGKFPIHLFSKLTKLTEKFNLNVIWDIPTRMNGKEIMLSALGDEKDLNKVARACKLLGSIKQISFSKNFLQGIDILQCLTERQKMILIKAKKEGYYEYPRKIDTLTLSERISLSKSTTIEHLRKAENKLISTVLSGY